MYDPRETNSQQCDGSYPSYLKQGGHNRLTIANSGHVRRWVSTANLVLDPRAPGSQECPGTRTYANVGDTRAAIRSVDERKNKRGDCRIRLPPSKTSTGVAVRGDSSQDPILLFDILHNSLQQLLFRKIHAIFSCSGMVNIDSRLFHYL